LEKDLKKTLAGLEEERVNSVKHKQVAVMLIKEQKKLVEKLGTIFGVLVASEASAD
jgi:hypothetical protein